MRPFIFPPGRLLLSLYSQSCSFCTIPPSRSVTSCRLFRCKPFLPNWRSPFSCLLLYFVSPSFPSISSNLPYMSPCCCFSLYPCLLNPCQTAALLFTTWLYISLCRTPTASLYISSYPPARLSLGSDRKSVV